METLGMGQKYWVTEQNGGKKRRKPHIFPLNSRKFMIFSLGALEYFSKILLFICRVRYAYCSTPFLIKRNMRGSRCLSQFFVLFESQGL